MDIIFDLLWKLSIASIVLGGIVFCIPSRIYPDRLRAFLTVGKGLYWWITGVLASVFFIVGGIDGGALPAAFFHIFWWGAIGSISFLPVWLTSTLSVFYLKKLNNAVHNKR